MADVTVPPAAETVRVVVVDDDALVRAGLRTMLAGDPTIEVVAELDDGDGVTRAVADHDPDVILMDVRMPRTDGVEAVRQLGEIAGAPPVIMLTTFDSDQTVLAALRAGAAGYLVKHTPPDQIIAAIHQSAAGEPVFSPSVLRTLVHHARSDQRAAAPHDELSERREAFAALSDRERAIARAVADGRSNAAIAADLYLSTGTVKADVSAMLAKLGAGNRIQLAILTHQLDGPSGSDPHP
ncbi:MAG: response regulator [Streptosporangiales bacterium]|nr:response regulator [Streptosporangiales bacterium]